MSTSKKFPITKYSNRMNAIAEMLIKKNYIAYVDWEISTINDKGDCLIVVTHQDYLDDIFVAELIIWDNKIKKTIKTEHINTVKFSNNNNNIIILGEHEETRYISVYNVAEDQPLLLVEEKRTRNVVNIMVIEHYLLLLDGSYRVHIYDIKDEYLNKASAILTNGRQLSEGIFTDNIFKNINSLICKIDLIKLSSSDERGNREYSFERNKEESNYFKPTNMVRNFTYKQS